MTVAGLDVSVTKGGKAICHEGKVDGVRDGEY
jgi:hypothetical protein